MNYASENIIVHAEKAQIEGISQLTLLRDLHNHSLSLARMKHFLSDQNPNFGFQGFDLIHILCWFGSTELLRLQIDECATNAEAKAPEYGTGLAIAAARQNTNTSLLLLDRKIDINSKGKWKYGNALQAAAGLGSKEIVALLLRNGADPNIQGGEFGNALQSAVVHARAHPRDDILVLLLRKNADVNILGGRYGTSLYAAIYYAEDKISNMLLENGADSNLHFGQNITPFQAALQTRLFWAIQTERRYEVVWVLETETHASPQESLDLATKADSLLAEYQKNDTAMEVRLGKLYKSIFIVEALLEHNAKQETLNLEAYKKTHAMLLNKNTDFLPLTLANGI